jgi:hypothetical protein
LYQIISIINTIIIINGRLIIRDKKTARNLTDVRCSLLSLSLPLHTSLFPSWRRPPAPSPATPPGPSPSTRYARSFSLLPAVPDREHSQPLASAACIRIWSNYLYMHGSNRGISICTLRTAPSGYPFTGWYDGSSLIESWVSNLAGWFDPFVSVQLWDVICWISSIIRLNHALLGVKAWIS